MLQFISYLFSVQNVCLSDTYIETWSLPLQDAEAEIHG